MTGGVGTNIYPDRYRDTDPQRARLVQQLVKMFVESGSDNKRKDSQDARSFIEEEIRDTRPSWWSRRTAQGLQAEELRRHGRVQPGLLHPHATLQLTDEVNKLRLSTARPSNRAMPSSANSPARRRSCPPEVPASARPTAGSPGLRNRAAPGPLARQLDELLRRYTDEHPDVVGTRRIIDQLEVQRQELAALQRSRWPGSAARLPRPPTRCSSSSRSRWPRPRPTWPRCACAGLQQQSGEAPRAGPPRAPDRGRARAAQPRLRHPQEDLRGAARAARVGVAGRGCGRRRWHALQGDRSAAGVAAAGVSEPPGADRRWPSPRPCWSGSPLPSPRAR